MATVLSTDDSNRFGAINRHVSVFDEDPDHVLRRRFTRLHLYNLYQKHQCLVNLDKAAGKFLRDLNAPNADQGHASFIDRGSISLDDFLSDIDKGLRDFDSASLLYQRSLQAPEVPKYFLDQFQAATRIRKSGFYHHYDIEKGWSECAHHIATEKGLVHRCIDRCMRYTPFLQWLYVTNSDTPDPLMRTYSEKAVRLTEDVFVNLGFCALLLIPTFLLSYVQSRAWKLVVVAVFLLLSTFLSSFMATATHKPGLAIAAGYAAILVVFLSGSST